MVLPCSQAKQYHNHSPSHQHQLRAVGSLMDSRSTPTEYQSSALNTASYQGYSTPGLDPQTAEQSVTPPQHQQASTQDVRSTYSSSATPTSETSALYSARTPTFSPDQIIGGPRYVEGTHRYQPANTTTGGMARNVPTTNSPPIKMEPKVSEDPSVVAQSPAAFASSSHYSAQYPSGPHAMSEGYPHPGAPNQPWRQEAWPYATPQMAQSPYGHSPSPTTMATAPPGMPATTRPVSANKARKRTVEQPPGHPLSQVYSFVPIPGAQQNKRPRRRYEEIERMYKCGWNGCEKAYGTLNHLNAHVTMQSHGTKRTPEEFKEIRKEWKARKKEEEAQRKAAEEEARRRAQEEAAATSSAEPQAAVAASQYVSGMSSQQRQLPPLSYSPSVSLPNGAVQYTTASTAPTAQMDSIPQYGQQQIYAGYAAPQFPGQAQQMFAGQQRPAPSQANGNANATTTGGEEPDMELEPDPDVTAASTYTS